MPALRRAHPIVGQVETYDPARGLDCQLRSDCRGHIIASSGEFLTTKGGRMRWPIRFQILIPFAGAMLVAVAAVTLLDAHLAARHSEAVVAQRLRDVVRTLLDS